MLAIFAIAFVSIFAFWRYRAMRRENEAHMQILCLTHPVTRDELSVRLAGLLRANEYLEVGSMLVRVPLKAGICYLGEPPKDIRAAINDADIAAHGEETVQFFSGSLQQETVLTTRMESLQRQALERQEFQVWYQPKYDLRTRRCIGASSSRSSRATASSPTSISTISSRS